MATETRPDSARRKAILRILAAVALAGALSACATDKPLPRCEGQVRILNPGKWQSTENDLKSACLASPATFASLQPAARS